MKVTFPSLYQINTRILLRELTQPRSGRPATLAHIPDRLFDGGYHIFDLEIA